MPPNPDRAGFHSRARHVRREAYGEQGIPQLAEALGILARTWENVEAGVAVPADIVLDFIVLTGVDPGWLRTGEGKPYADRTASK